MVNNYELELLYEGKAKGFINTITINFLLSLKTMLLHLTD